MKSIDNLDHDYFLRLGGATGVDLNFIINKDETFPLLVVAAKGDIEFLNLMLCNPTIDINKIDINKVNAFFMAAYHSNILVMR